MSSRQESRQNTESEDGTVVTEPVSKAGSKRSHVSTRCSRTSWVVYGSPLWHADSVPPPSVRTLPPLRLKELEHCFVNDALKTTTRCRSQQRSIIPSYNAVRDKYARHYFKSPAVCAMMERNKELKAHKEQQSKDNRRSLNKLSIRRRCRRSPNTAEISSREFDFVNDAIVTERGRTKYKDIIPPYTASGDSHCKGYFKRPDIKRLMALTYSPRHRVS